MNFADRLLRAIDKKENYVIVGLDPDVEFIPQHIQNESLDRFPPVSENDFRAVGYGFLKFNKQIIDAVEDLVPAVKLNVAFYEIYQAPGIIALDKTTKYAKEKGLVVIEDAKRNEVGNTARKYAEGHLGRVKLFGREGETRKEVPSFDFDAMTVNGYLGSDCTLEFTKKCKQFDKGIFVLDKTSNPSAGEIQDLVLESGIKLSEEVAHMIEEKWSEGTAGKEGYKSVGAVVGATYAPDAEVLRRIMPSSIFLVPGLDPKVQGGKPEDAPYFLNKDGRAAVFNLSRGAIAAFREPEYFEKYGEKNHYKAAREKVIKMREATTLATRKAEKSRW